MAKSSLLKKVAAEVADANTEAEQLLRESVSTNTQLSFEAQQFMKTRLGWDSREQDRQRARTSTVMRFQLVVGTSKARKALADSLREATEALEQTRPELEEQIRTLQNQLQALERDKNQLAKRQADVDAGLQSLMSLAPPANIDKFNQLNRIAKETLGLEAGELKGEIQHAECLSDPDRYQNPNDYLETVRRYDRTAVLDVSTKGRQRLKLSPDWEPKRIALENELPARRKRLEALEAELATQLEAAREPLKHYWR